LNIKIYCRLINKMNLLRTLNKTFINPNLHPLEFQIVDWRAYDNRAFKNDEDEDGSHSDDEEEEKQKVERKYVIEIYGFDKEKRSVCLTVTDFTPYFFVEISRDWTVSKLTNIIEKVKARIESSVRSDLVDWKIVERKKFFGFCNEEKYTFVRFTFKSRNAFYAYKKQLEDRITLPNTKGFITFKNQLYEADMDPMLRFIHLRDLDPAGWVKVNIKDYTTNINANSKCNLDLTCHWKKVHKSNEMMIGAIRIMSFDIECTSIDGSFPSYNRPGDKVIQIGSTCHEYGSREIHFRHIVTLGKSSAVEGTIVESYTTERDVLLGWARMVEKYDPDIITGYNIFGFDWEYLYMRAKLGMGNNKIDYTSDFLKYLSRSRKWAATFVEKQLSSSALGDNMLKYIDCPGRVPIDLLKLVQKDHKLDSYKLDNVAEFFLKTNKIDLKPHQIFAKFAKGGPADIGEIATYCIRDCELCNQLVIKLEAITGNTAMANICTIPFSYLFLRGQGIKIFSLVGKYCQKEGYLIKTLEKFDGEISLEGAYVFTPDPKIWMDPIVVLDYNSLYPSSMISENLSPDTLVEDPKYMNLPGWTYNSITYDVFEGKGDDKKKVGEKTSIFVEKANGDKGILPRILMQLLKARADTRAKIPHKTVELNDKTVYTGFLKDKKDEEMYELIEEEGKKHVINKKAVLSVKDTYNEFQKAILEGRQLALKITANSIYGQTGAPTSKIFCEPVAASTTATGRRLLRLARDGVTTQYPGTQCIYGDSVVGDTPLLLLNTETNKIVIKTIESLVEESDWTEYDNFKPDDKSLSCKEKASCPYLVWSKGKWSAIRKVIRHKTKKDIYRVTTHTGCVDVTEDHSLLDKNGVIVKPKDAVIGQELLHSYPTQIDMVVAIKTDDFFSSTDTVNPFSDLIKKVYDFNKEHSLSMEEMEAHIFGFFYSDGSCGRYPTTWGVKYSWALNNADMRLLERCLDYLHMVEGGRNFTILNTIESSAVYKLVPLGDIKYMVQKYRPIFYDKDKYKIIPEHILNGSYEVRMSFLVGYYSGDGAKCLNEKTKCIRLDNKGKIGSSQLYFLLRSLGYNCSINTRSDKTNIFRITSTPGKQRKNPIAIKKKELIAKEYTEYVYDLETDVGCFQAGIGEMIVKNTDSVFLNFAKYLETTYGPNLSAEEKLQKSYELGNASEKYMSTILKYPHNCGYEKIFYPFIIFTKKRYVGNKYEKDMKKYKQAAMGIALKRRDYAPLVKIIYNNVLDWILNKRDQEGAKTYFKEQVGKLLMGDIDIKDLVITKNLGSNYANPTTIAHKVLADRMGERDPGNKPQSNDRMSFCFIDERELKCYSCGEKKIKANNCKCIKCLHMFCQEHLKAHCKMAGQCKTVCRFCRTNENVNKCATCQGWYCEDDMIKHNRRKDKYGKEHHDKCKKELSTKLLQGDIIESVEYIKEKELKLDYRYYLDHQISTPCLQIFDLMMKDSQSLIKSALREDDNKKSGNQEITKWFQPIKKSVSSQDEDTDIDDKGLDDIDEDNGSNEDDIELYD